MKTLAKEIIKGRRLTRSDDLSIFEHANLAELAAGADLIRKSFCQNHVHLCTIINGRSGRCGEDCKFCAQSASSQTGCETYEMLDEETILRDCKEKKPQAYILILSLPQDARLAEKTWTSWCEFLNAYMKNVISICAPPTAF